MIEIMQPPSSSTVLFRGQKIFSEQVWRLALKLLISMLFGKMNSEKAKENI